MSTSTWGPELEPRSASRRSAAFAGIARGADAFVGLLQDLNDSDIGTGRDLVATFLDNRHGVVPYPAPLELEQVRVPLVMGAALKK